MTKWVSDFGYWLAGRPAAVLMFFLGLAAGYSLQLSPFGLNESFVQIVSSFIGAVITLFGAFWLAGTQRRREALAVRDRVAVYESMVVRRAQELDAAIDSVVRDQDGWEQIFGDACSNFRNDANTAHDGIGAMPGFHELGSRGRTLCAKLMGHCNGLCTWGPDSSLSESAMERARADLKRQMKVFSQLVAHIGKL